MLKNPQNRAQAAAALAESLGGSIETAYLSFGEYDTAVIANLPDNVSAAAVSMAVSASGAWKVVKTTPLLTIEEGMDAMRKGAAAVASYRPPTA
jgi:uncharacterized protein with GYD domain